MRDGFVKVAAVTPKIRVADTKYNAGVIVEGIPEAVRREGDRATGACHHGIYLQ